MSKFTKEYRPALIGCSILLIPILCFVSLIILGITGLSSGDTTIASNKFNYTHISGNKDADAKLLTIPVNGLIMNQEGGSNNLSSLLESGMTYGYEVKDQLMRAAENSNIKGVILEINSPGGTVTGSEAIADGIAYYKQETDNPVIAFISGLGASGAYWAATPADEITVDVGSTLGSIGVVNGVVPYYDKPVAESEFLGKSVVTEEGIEYTYISAGEGKDMGNPYRRLTAQEKQVLQTSANNAYQKFVEKVTTNRDISKQKLQDTIGAYTYGVKQALDLKLVDKELNREESYQRLADLAEVNEYQLIKEEEEIPGFLGSLLGAETLTAFLDGSTAKVKQGFSCDISAQPLAIHGNPLQICKL